MDKTTIVKSEAVGAFDAHVPLRFPREMVIVLLAIAVSSCGSCTSPNTCGGGGTVNVCGQPGSIPNGGTTGNFPARFSAPYVPTWNDNDLVLKPQAKLVQLVSASRQLALQGDAEAESEEPSKG